MVRGGGLREEPSLLAYNLLGHDGGRVVVAAVDEIGNHVEDPESLVTLELGCGGKDRVPA